MINLDKLLSLVEKYKESVLREMLEHEHESPDEAVTHTEQQAKAGRGNKAAKQFMLSFMKSKIINVVNEEDKKTIKTIVVSEYQTIKDKKNVKSNTDKYIEYYDLLMCYMKEEDKERFLTVNFTEPNFNGMNEFCLLMYQATYGAGYIEPFLNLNINNIEIHGTRKILIETNEGVWKTIKNYRFQRDKDIERVAKRLMAQDDKEDITPKNCEMEGMLEDGQRISIALKPGCMENTIFIKKFDGVKVNTADDLIEKGTITSEIKKELEIYGKGRANVAFIGGINTGKTTTMRGYVGLIPDEYKIGVVTGDFETAWSSLYPDKDIIALKETEKYTLENQFSRLLRMNRNILAIEEARGEEVEQWIEGCTRGSDGSFMSMHTRKADDFINNVTWMCLKNGTSVDIKVLRSRVASAVDIVIRLWHSPDGRRIVDEISEIVTVSDNIDVPYRIVPIYKRDIVTNDIKKVGCISDELAEKFSYYNVSYDELQEIMKK